MSAEPPEKQKTNRSDKMNAAVQMKEEVSEKEELIADFKRLKNNIDGALRIQEEKGNGEAAWIRKHL